MSEGDKYEFTLAENKEPPKKSKLVLCLGGSLLLLSVAVIAAVSAIIYQYFALAAHMKDLTVTCKPADVVKQYPGYFRTPQEQIEVERRYNQDPQYLPPTVPLPNCSLDCNYRAKRDTRHVFSPLNKMEALVVSAGAMRKLARTKRQEENPRNPIFHACCESQKSWIAPTTATNQVGDTVEVIQLEEHKQYFLQESCRGVIGCNICTCAQPEPFLYQAIVYTDEDKLGAKNDFIKYPGCCKCLNIGPSN